MTVLRSREITPVVKSKSKTPGRAPEVESFVPDIPAKTGEGADENLNAQSHLTPGSITVGLGSGSVQRRSARLALKTNLGLTKVTGNVKKSSRKEKELNSGDDKVNNIINGFNLGDLETEFQVDIENEDMHMRTKDAGVADCTDLETGNSEGPAVETRVTRNEFTQLAGPGIPGEIHDRVESTRNGKRKRRLSKEILLGFEHAGQCDDEGEGNRSFLNLRCGKKIAKVEVKGDILHDQTEKIIGVNLDCSKQNVTILKDGRADGGTGNLSKADTIETESGSLNSGLKFCREEKDKTNALEENSITMTTSLVELDFEEANGNTERIDKGKGKLIESILVPKSETRVVAENGNAAPSFSDVTPSQELVDKEPESFIVVQRRRLYRERSQDVTRRNASRFAHFSSRAEEEEDNDFANAPAPDSTPSQELFHEEPISSILAGRKRHYRERSQDVTRRNSARFAHFSSQAEEEEDNDFANAPAPDGTPSQGLVMNESISSILSESRRHYMERSRDVTRRNASRFARFSSQAEEEEDNYFAPTPAAEIPQSENNRIMEDWPGPFYTAMKIIRDREMNARLLQGKASVKSRAASVLWIPKKEKKCNIQKKSAPLLQDLCMSILAKNSDAIVSLECVPDIMRHKLSHLLCNARRMNSHFLQLLLHDSPTEIQLVDCSWLTEDDFTRAFEQCDFSNLTVLQLDHGGRCLADYILTTTLARSPKSLPALISLSLRGAYRLSDAGLCALVSSVPELRSINLRECSLLTSNGICYLGASLGSVLTELYLDDCQGIDAMAILPALLKIDNLEVLSLAGIETVSDSFIHQLSCVKGHNMKELVLANCTKLTDISVRVIAQTCPKLRAVDFSNLCKLTDAAIGFLANGCQAIQNLKLCRNELSDEAVAAYLEICGEPLKELSLSNVTQVAENTAISLSRHSRNLNRLDLSWCRNLTEEALGLIVDSCSYLKVLKVFGCTQITDVFLSGHSNSVVEIIGVKMNQVLEHLETPDFLRCPVRYSFPSRSM